MTHLFLPAILLGLLLPSALATRAVASDREWHTAQCVAALDVHTAALAGQVKAGQEALRPLLLERLQSGAAFVGAAYLRGERDEARAKALLKEALEAQKTLPEAALTARQLECAEEGARLLAQASFFEREVVSLFARRRLNKLLGPRARRRRRRPGGDDSGRRFVRAGRGALADPLPAVLRLCGVDFDSSASPAKRAARGRDALQDPTVQAIVRTLRAQRSASSRRRREAFVGSHRCTMSRTSRA
jgi:hypothetical protein